MWDVGVSINLGMEGKVTTWELAQGEWGLGYLLHAKTFQSQKIFLHYGAGHFFLRILRPAYIQCGCEGIIALNTMLESAWFFLDVLERTIFFFFKKSTIQTSGNYASYCTAMWVVDVHRQALGQRTINVNKLLIE